MGRKRMSPAVVAYESALEVLEAHDRPPTYRGLTPDTRARASFAQVRVFSRSYWPMWRYVKICLYQRLLDERDAIAADLPNLLRGDHVSPTSRAFQDITNGLLAAAAAEFCQYAEDLGIICHALSAGDYFAQKLTRFNAGHPQNEVKRWSTISDSDVRDFLFIPKVALDPPWPNADCQRIYVDGIAEARGRLQSISTLYQQWFQHHIRYKHGLALALAPYVEQIDDSAFVDRRRSDDRGYPVAFDAACVADLVVRPDFHQFPCVPSIDCDDLKWNVLKLSRERNLLRYVIPPMRDVDGPSLGDFAKAAYTIGQLQQIALFNYLENKNPDRLDREWRCQVPHGEKFAELASAGRAGVTNAR